MMTELILGLIGVVIGSIITYLFSIRLLRKQLESQQAYDFVSKNYLPLLSAIKEYKSTIGMWAMIKTNNQNRSSLSEEEALKICGEATKFLREAIESFIKSGMCLIIRNIDKQLGEDIFAFQEMRIWNPRFKVPESITESNIYLDPHFLDELDGRLSKLSIPELVAEYQNVMKKGFKPKGGS